MPNLPSIVAKLKHSNTVEYKDIINNIRGSVIITQSKIQLNRNRLYYIPIDDQTISLDNSNIIKPRGVVSELMDIRNVSDGFVTILPLFNNVIIKNGQLLGWLL